MSIHCQGLQYILLQVARLPNPDAHRQENCAKLLSHVPWKFSRVAQKVLEALLMEEELASAVHALEKGKSLGPDGLMANFSKTN